MERESGREWRERERVEENKRGGEWRHSSCLHTARVSFHQHCVSTQLASLSTSTVSLHNSRLFPPALCLYTTCVSLHQHRVSTQLASLYTSTIDMHFHKDFLSTFQSMTPLTYKEELMADFEQVVHIINSVKFPTQNQSSTFFVSNKHISFHSFHLTNDLQ